MRRLDLLVVGCMLVVRWLAASSITRLLLPQTDSYLQVCNLVSLAPSSNHLAPPNATARLICCRSGSGSAEGGSWRPAAASSGAIIRNYARPRHVPCTRNLLQAGAASSLRARFPLATFS